MSASTTHALQYSLYDIYLTYMISMKVTHVQNVAKYMTHFKRCVLCQMLNKLHIKDVTCMRHISYERCNMYKTYYI